MTERLTIDTGVHFHHLITGTEARLENLAIIELKRDGRTYSPIGEILRELHVRPRELVNIVWEPYSQPGT